MYLLFFTILRFVLKIIICISYLNSQINVLHSFLLSIYYNENSFIDLVIELFIFDK